jgi:hypothetical protein
MFKPDVATLDVANVLESLDESVEIWLFFLRITRVP